MQVYHEADPDDGDHEADADADDHHDADDGEHNADADEADGHHDDHFTDDHLDQTGEGTSCYYRFLTKGQQWIWLQTRSSSL